MELKLSDLLKGKATTIKNKNYFSTQKYVEPFIEKMSPFTDEFIVKAMLPSQVTTDQEKTDITYNKVWIQAVLPEEYCVDNHSETIGLIYALDVRKPVAKIYRGYLNQACLNLTVFDPKWINVQELQPEKMIKYSVQELMEMESTFGITLKYLKETFLDRTNILTDLGTWVDSCIKNEEYNKVHTVKLSPDIAIEAYKNVFIDNDSDSFISKEKEVSLFDMYNAFTQILTKDTKDIINKVEKTLLVNKLLIK